MKSVIRLAALAAAVGASACTSNSLQGFDGFALNGSAPAIAAQDDAIAAIIAEASNDVPPGMADAGRNAAPATAEAASQAAPAVVAAADAGANTGPNTGADAGANTGAGEKHAATEPAPARKKGFFSAFWPSRNATDTQLVTASLPVGDESRPAARRSGKADRVTRTTDTKAKSALARDFRAGDALPGVRTDELFEISRRSGGKDDADIDANESDGSYRVASAAGLARLTPNGLRTQREDVDVACLKPQLVHLLKKIERHYGRPVVVTSGYRDPGHNRRVSGARNSLHMNCAAADIQIAGVSKWELAKFVRSMPGRGGVGTYCHTESVHVDVGPERDWNWRCRRRKG